jgi:hypothetical protein
LPAQFSERPRGTVSVNHNVVRLNRDDKIAVVTPDTNLPLCARQHGNPLLCGQAITPVSNSARYMNKSAISLFVAFLQRVMA